ncbi:MAG: hypothetical protein M1833_002654 [Piccolia ochrophora]|nr:MAG: hypothetical protein M1833_002654 [Piccolia ochrophora]
MRLLYPVLVATVYWCRTTLAGVSSSTPQHPELPARRVIREVVSDKKIQEVRYHDPGVAGIPSILLLAWNGQSALRLGFNDTVPGQLAETAFLVTDLLSHHNSFRQPPEKRKVGHLNHYADDFYSTTYTNADLFHADTGIAHMVAFWQQYRTRHRGGQLNRDRFIREYLCQGNWAKSDCSGQSTSAIIFCCLGVKPRRYRNMSENWSRWHAAGPDGHQLNPTRLYFRRSAAIVGTTAKDPDVVESEVEWDITDPERPVRVGQARLGEPHLEWA